MREIWKPIRGFKNSYLISTYGRVLQIKYNKLLKVQSFRTGYKYIRLRSGKKYRHCLIHRLVLENFTKPSRLTVNHKDFDKCNNRLDNLEYLTKEQNRQHAIKNKKHAHHDTHGRSKLSLKKILQIREMYKKKTMCQWQMAKFFGVHETTIHRAIKGRTWS